MRHPHLSSESVLGWQAAALSPSTLTWDPDLSARLRAQPMPRRPVEEDVPAVPDSCPHCNDTGWVLRIVIDKVTGVIDSEEQRCRCA